ncbi:MAG TPA: hypothetical protein VM925_10210 [Labilithrix sp.]|nr:hypothetical protein [Labilithrix sp.]
MRRQERGSRIRGFGQAPGLAESEHARSGTLFCQQPRRETSRMRVERVERPGSVVFAQRELRGAEQEHLVVE